MINPIARLHPSSPDPVITKEVKKLRYDQAALPRFAHLTYITDFINDEILPAVNSLSASGFQGLIDAADICPIGLKNWYWVVDTGGAIPGGGPVVESGDQLICTTDNPVAGDWAAAGANFMIVEKNISPTSVVNALTFDTSNADTRPGMIITAGTITAADAGVDARLQLNSKGAGDIIFRSGTGNLDISSNSASVTAYFDAQINTATTIQVRGQNSMSVDLVTPTSSATFKGLVLVSNGAGTGAGRIAGVNGATGQALTVQGGDSTGGAGTGGAATLYGGFGAPGGVGGAANVYGAHGQNGGGAVNITAGNSTVTGFGGDVQIHSGDGMIDGAGGNIMVHAGIAYGINPGGMVDLKGGENDGTSSGGNVNATGGDASHGTGGEVHLVGGNSITTGDGGGIYLVGGDSSATGVGGSIHLTGGPAGGLGSTAGNIIAHSPFVVKTYTTAQRTALTAVTGMIVFDSDMDKFQGYTNAAWVGL